MARYVDTKQGKNDVSDMEMLYGEHIARLSYQNRDELATLYKQQRDRLSTALKEDVAPVIHAHWVMNKKSPYGYNCSNCGAQSYGKTNYCKDCGAKMDEEVSE